MRVAARIFTMLIATAGLSLFAAETVSAGEPGWNPRVIVRGKEREKIKNKPIHLRPYRPMHFYGNTQRRIYYRNNQTARASKKTSPSVNSKSLKKR